MLAPVGHQEAMALEVPVWRSALQSAKEAWSEVEERTGQARKWAVQKVRSGTTVSKWQLPEMAAWRLPKFSAQEPTSPERF